jgi:hypothetical protein
MSFLLDVAKEKDWVKLDYEDKLWRYCGKILIANTVNHVYEVV